MSESKKTKTECNLCKTIDGIPFKCNYCQNYYCGIHRNPINHSCSFLYAYNKRKTSLGYHTKTAQRDRKTIVALIYKFIKIKTSKTELFHLSIASTLVTCVGLSLNNYKNYSWEFLTIFLSAFIIHELAHKFLAQYYGSWAEFRFEISGLLITAISALPIMPFKFIAPGAVMIGLRDRNKIGKVALIGPLTNIVMGFSFLSLSVIIDSNSYFSTGASFNGWIAMFNLMPFGVLDGQKIIRWNKLVWGLIMSTSMILFIISYL